MKLILLCVSGCPQGWEQCVCLDMNAFYLGLLPEEERCRVEMLEPFDEHEVSLIDLLSSFLQHDNQETENLTPIRSGTRNVPTISSSPHLEAL